MPVTNSQGGFSAQLNSAVTNWEEHSAVADLSTGRRFKAVQTVPLRMKIDSSNPDNIYIGFTKPGVLTSEPYWRIKRIVVGSVDDYSFANGEDTFVNIWDNRASLSYS